MLTKNARAAIEFLSKKLDGLEMPRNWEYAFRVDRMKNGEFALVIIFTLVQNNCSAEYIYDISTNGKFDGFGMVWTRFETFSWKKIHDALYMVKRDQHGVFVEKKFYPLTTWRRFQLRAQRWWNNLAA